jgi:hypothetical protein
MMDFANSVSRAHFSGMLAPQTYALLLWGGLGVLTLTLFLLMRTRWGQAQPLSKCVALSVLAHGLFAGYAYGTRLFCEIPMIAEDDTLRLAFITNLSEDESEELPATENQWGVPLVERAPVPEQYRLERRDAAEPVEEPERDVVQPRDEVQQLAPASVDDLVESLAEGPAEEEGAGTEPTWPDTPPVEMKRTTVMAEAAPIEVPVPQAVAAAEPPRPELASSQRRPIEDDDPPSDRDAAEPTAADLLVPELVDGGTQVQQLADALESVEVQEARSGEEQLAEASNRDPGAASPEGAGRADEAKESADVDGQYVGAVPPVRPGSSAVVRRVGDGAEFPQLLRARVAPDRPLLMQQYGGTADTEAAVQTALSWLAANQSEEGRWRARDFGAGDERMVLGHNRLGAGKDGDTGMTALALLAFLGAGHTHYEGKFRTNVQHGLEFLLRTQSSDGSLAGNAELFAAMYCHGLAFLAVSEAYAMTGDERIKPFVERAQRYTLAAQISQDGGWRYQRGDHEGDTSQLGWQLMALRSAELAGIPLPGESRRGMQRFLESVAAGRQGGLAGYRPGSRPSRTMTAEALTCWIFLEQPPPLDARREAARYLSEERPGDGLPNLYYWYYGSLALFQLQDEAWRPWNAALQTELLSLQRKEGALAGSWDPNKVWGG